MSTKPLHWIIQSDFVDPDAIDFAEKVLSIWMPHVNCVVDIADCYDHFKVIEFNCLNGSGFYHSDVRAIVSTIQNTGVADA